MELTLFNPQYFIEKIFNALVNNFVNDKIGIANDFLNQPLAGRLKENLISLYDLKQFKSAGTGNETIILLNKLVRSDKIYWLDRKHNNIYENEFFDLIDDFVKYLNETCYTGITGYEFHYALYEEGSFYKRHLDQFKNNNNRKYSLIMYLNTDWKEMDGGQLCIYNNNKIHKISPVSGKGVFFKSSELEHEVLITNKPRLSITGWLNIKS